MEKALSTGDKIVLKAPDSAIASSLDQALWTYDASGFLPHGVEGCKHANLQPLYITTQNDNPAGAAIQVLVNAVDSENTTDFKMCLYMFDGRDERIVAKARSAWKAYSAGDHKMSYWQQKETGGWEQKA